MSFLEITSSGLESLTCGGDSIDLSIIKSSLIPCTGIIAYISFLPYYCERRWRGTNVIAPMPQMCKRNVYHDQDDQSINHSAANRLSSSYSNQCDQFARPTAPRPVSPYQVSVDGMNADPRTVQCQKPFWSIQSRHS